MGSKRALITGITGQDGSYLAEFLLAKGYEVAGLVRRSSTPHTQNIAHILSDITLIQGDLLDQSSLMHALECSGPCEVYNLAAMSHVGTSFKQPIVAAEINGLGAIRLLEAIRQFNPKIRFYQASTSELFGNALSSPQDEATPFCPRSPYAISKLLAHHATVNYREAHDMFTCCGILFNHESPRRSLDFVTRKITDGVTRIKYGLLDRIELGNIGAGRDWGYAGDYVEAMWSMLQQREPGDYVIATGETHTVGEFIKLACEYAGLPQEWHNYILIDPELYRPADVNALCGNAFKARHMLNWQPKTDFKTLVALMVQSDLWRYRNENKPTAFDSFRTPNFSRYSSLEAI